MEPLTFSPRKEQKTIWLITWFIWFCTAAVPIIAGVIFIPEIEGRIVFGVILVLYVLIMVLLGVWIPAFFRSISYRIDDNTVKMNCGVFWKKLVTVPFQKITNIDISQGPLQREYNIGTIHVQTAGAGGSQGGRAELRLSGVREIEDVKDRIMNGVQKRHTSSMISSHDEKSELSLLNDILNELKAVKEILEKKQL
ncbi:PH domain-containing protein [Candidatus Latescibacterota bacterium]